MKQIKYIPLLNSLNFPRQIRFGRELSNRFAILSNTFYPSVLLYLEASPAGGSSGGTSTGTGGSGSNGSGCPAFDASCPSACVTMDAMGCLACTCSGERFVAAYAKHRDKSKTANGHNVRTSETLYYVDKYVHSFEITAKCILLICSFC